MREGESLLNNTNSLYTHSRVQTGLAGAPPSSHGLHLETEGLPGVCLLDAEVVVSGLAPDLGRTQIGLLRRSRTERNTGEKCKRKKGEAAMQEERERESWRVFPGHERLAAPNWDYPSSPPPSHHLWGVPLMSRGGRGKDVQGK